MQRETCSLEVRLTIEELKEAAEAFHFQSQDLPLLREVYEAMCPVQARAWLLLRGSRMEGALTLGHGVDRLQEHFTDEGRTMESYMVECLAMECMKRAYCALAVWLQEKTGFWMGKMQFPESEDTVQDIAGMLAGLDQNEITCNQASMMTPLKSVVFTAELFTKRPEGNLCDVCAGCHNPACHMRRAQKRADGLQADRENSVRAGNKRLNYGYRRIFGPPGQE